MIVTCLHFSLCLSVLLSITTSRTLVVHGVQPLWTSKLLKKTSETFDDVRSVLTIIWVASECRDSVGLAYLSRGTLLMRIHTKTKKGYMKGALGMEVP
jgi:hypothetical protein